MPIIGARARGAKAQGPRDWARRNWWQIGVLTIAGWTAFYVAVILPMQSQNTVATSRVATQRSVTLHSINWNEPISLLRSPSWSNLMHPMASAGPRPPLLLHKVAASRASLLGSHVAMDGPALADVSAEDSERKTVRTAELDLEVRNPAQSAPIPARRESKDPSTRES